MLPALLTSGKSRLLLETLLVPGLVALSCAVHFGFAEGLDTRVITGPDAAHWGIAAQALKSGHLGDYPEFRPPVFPALAVLFSAFTGDLAAGGRLVSLLLGSLLFLPFYLAARSMFGAIPAVTASLLIIMNRKLLLVSTQFCSDMTSAFLVGCAVCLAWLTFSRGGALLHFLLGAALAACYLTSLPNFILIPPVALLLMLRFFRRGEKAWQKALSFYLFLMGFSVLLTLKLIALGGLSEGLQQVQGGIRAFAGSGDGAGAPALLSPARAESFARNIAQLLNNFPFPPRVMALFLLQGLLVIGVKAGARPPLRPFPTVRELFLLLVVAPSLAFPFIILQENFTFTERFMTPYIAPVLLLAASGALKLAALPLGLLSYIPLFAGDGSVRTRAFIDRTVAGAAGLLVVAAIAPGFHTFCAGYGKSLPPYPYASEVLQAAAWLRSNTAGDAIVISRVPEVVFHAERRYRNPVKDPSFLEFIRYDISQGSKAPYYIVLTDIPVGEKDTLENYVDRASSKETLARVWSTDGTTRYRVEIFRIKGSGESAGEQ